MANTSGIRAHMKSVSSIGKITGAMQMVASARMHQAQPALCKEAPAPPSGSHQ